jgi:hypothetical protein
MALVRLVIEYKIARLVVTYENGAEDLIIDNIPLGILSVYIKEFSHNNDNVYKECCKLVSVYLRQKSQEFDRFVNL